MSKIFEILFIVFITIPVLFMIIVLIWFVKFVIIEWKRDDELYKDEIERIKNRNN